MAVLPTCNLWVFAGKEGATAAQPSPAHGSLAWSHSCQTGGTLGDREQAPICQDQKAPCSMGTDLWGRSPWAHCGSFSQWSSRSRLQVLDQHHRTVTGGQFPSGRFPPRRGWVWWEIKEKSQRYVLTPQYYANVSDKKLLTLDQSYL